MGSSVYLHVRKNSDHVELHNTLICLIIIMLSHYCCYSQGYVINCVYMWIFVLKMDVSKTSDYACL